MSSPRSIDVDADVWRRLQQEAVPFEDTPNTVLRRLLGLDSGARRGTGVEAASAAAAGGRSADAAGTGSGAAARVRRTKPATRKGKARAKRASSADLLAETAYELPILAALADAGGRAPTREVLDAVGVALSEQLTAVDRETTTSGTTRWHSRAQLVRLRLVKAGDMLSDSPRGVWEVSDAGRARVAGEDAR